MAGIAAAAGVPIESVGDGPAMFGRPVVAQAEEGPIVEVLRERAAGSSEEVNAAGRSVVDAGALVQQEEDSAGVGQQTDAALLVNIAGVDPSAPSESVLDSTIAGDAA